MPSNVSMFPLKSVTTTNCSQVETPTRTTSMQMSFLETFLTVCAEILWLCKPIVAAAVRVAGLRWSWRWRCWIWRSWAGVVTRGLRLWGQLDVLPNSLKYLWRWLMVDKWSFSSWATGLVDIPAVSMPIARLCCVIKLHILEWPFIVTSLRHTCAIIMLSNQHLDMPHLWGGWIILAKEKCSLRQICEQYLREIGLFFYLEKVLDLWVQLMKNGGKNKCCIYNFVQCVCVYIYIYTHCCSKGLDQ